MKPIPISDAPRHLPARSGGAAAFKFRDPDGHPLELIQFPDGHDDGIDHSAIVVLDAERSIAFYRDHLGFDVASSQINTGQEQDRLDALPDVTVEVVALTPHQPTPHLELLAYRSPTIRTTRRLRPHDVAATRLVLEIDGLPADATHLSDGKCVVLIHDPDEHALLLMSPPPQAELSRESGSLLSGASRLLEDIVNAFRPFGRRLGGVIRTYSSGSVRAKPRSSMRPPTRWVSVNAVHPTTLVSPRGPVATNLAEACRHGIEQRGARVAHVVYHSVYLRPWKVIFRLMPNTVEESEDNWRACRHFDHGCGANSSSLASRRQRRSRASLSTGASHWSGWTYGRCRCVTDRMLSLRHRRQRAGI